MAHTLYRNDKKTPFPQRLQHLAKLWQKKNATVLEHQNKLLELWASGFYDKGYSREHLINLIDRGVYTIVPYLVEGNPRVTVETLAVNYKPWAYTTQLALNFLLKKMKFADRVLIPAAINSMFGAGITRTFTEYNRVISLDDEVIKSGSPTVKVIHDSDYIGDPLAKTRDDFVFEGDIYRLPTEYAKELFDAKVNGKQVADYICPDVKLATDFSPDKISDPNFNIQKYSLRDTTTFIDIYLYDENVTVTIMPEGQKARILRTVEEDGPFESPYDYLGYKYFPNCPTPIPPAWFWHDQDVSMNIVARTAREQAESQKDLLLADSANKDLAQKVESAKNMDVLLTSDPKDSVLPVSFGGMNPSSIPWMGFVEDVFTKAGGTSDIVAGRGAESPTLGQEKMNFQNASRIINNMGTRFHEFMNSIIKKLAWKVWTDPTVYIPVIKEIPGVANIPEVFSQADTVGDFYDFVFEVEEFSTQRMSPELKYQRLMALSSQWILPTLPLAAQQGANFDIPEATKQMAAYLGLEGFGALYKTAIPNPTDIIPYKMGTGAVGTGSPGQENDSMGASLPSREANSQRQENKVDLTEI